jgi:hypothetical protein
LARSRQCPARWLGLAEGLAVGLADGLADGLVDGLAATGAGRGLGGSTENLGFWLGGATTMPTTPSEVKSTYGRTRARAVSEPARFSTLLITPTGTPGT